MAIVVGYDGSPASETAVWWAAEEAVWRRTRIRLAYALPLPLLSSPMGVIAPLPTDAVREVAEQLLGQVAERIRYKYPALTVDAVVTFGGTWPWSASISP